MADLQFHFLHRRDVRFLSTSENLNNRIAYLDGLALLQDMLSGSGTNSKNPVFLDNGRRERLFKRVLDRLHRSSENIVHNLRVNRSIASRLSRSTFDPSFEPLSYDDLYPIDKYRTDLLDQYEIIRRNTRFRNRAD